MYTHTHTHTWEVSFSCHCYSPRVFSLFLTHTHTHTSDILKLVCVLSSPPSDSCHFTLDPNTANTHLHKEVERSGGVGIAVSYKSISRKGLGNESGLGKAPAPLSGTVVNRLNSL